LAKLAGMKRRVNSLARLGELEDVLERGTFKEFGLWRKLIAVFMIEWLVLDLDF
jgi:hypothetical protein